MRLNGNRAEQRIQSAVVVLLLFNVILSLTSCSFLLPKTTVLITESALQWGDILVLAVEDVVDWVQFILKVVLG